jgi:short-subunit dehydrogenase
MSPVIAVLGAGTGLGAAVAHRFGREGFTVALVGRRRDRLEALRAELETAGIRSGVFIADLADPSGIPPLMRSIETELGAVDVVEYGPVSADLSFTPARDLDAAALSALVPLFLLSPVEVVAAVLPGMLKRGRGSILLTQGSFAVTPVPFASGPGPVMAATRNYVHSLAGELAGTGVHVGMLAIGASIDRSEMSELAQAEGDGATNGRSRVNPDDLAELYWGMHARHDAVEIVHPDPQASAQDQARS